MTLSKAESLPLQLLTSLNHKKDPMQMRSQALKDLFVTGETKRETQRLLEFAKPFRHEEEMKNEKPDGDQVRLRKRFRKDGQTTVERRDPGSCFLQGCPLGENQIY